MKSLVKHSVRFMEVISPFIELALLLLIQGEAIGRDKVIVNDLKKDGITSPGAGECGRLMKWATR